MKIFTTENVYKVQSFLLISVIGISLVLLGVFASRWNLSTQWLSIYVTLGAVAILYYSIAFVVDWVKTATHSNWLSQMAFAYEKSYLSPLSIFPGLGIAVAVFLAIIIVIVVTSTNSFLFAPPNPYTASVEFDVASYESASGFSNFMTGAFVPGILEEAVILAGIQMTSFTLLVLLTLFVGQNVLKNWIIIWATRLVALFTWCFVFVAGHARYGGNQATQVWAYITEFIMQGTNLLSGGLYSPIIHISHNAAVITVKAFSFAILGG